MIKFNIGSAVNGVDQYISSGEAAMRLWQAGFVRPELIKTAMSNTETTYVFVAESFDASGHFSTHEAAVHMVCFQLSQDAIAYTVDGTGYLVGPKAEDWGGEFNPEYFIE